MARAKRTVPARDLAVRVDEEDDNRLRRLALVASSEAGAPVLPSEVHRRLFRPMLALGESCRECRAGTCDGSVHVRPSQTAAAQKDATIGDLAVAAEASENSCIAGHSGSVAVVSIVKTMAVDGAGQGALFGSAPALIVGDAPAAPKRKRSTSTARTYPEGFALTDEMRAYAERNGIAAERVTDMFEHFSTHHRAKGSKFVDWTLAFYTWVRNDRQFGGANQKRTGEPSAIQGGGKDGIPW